MDHHCAFTGKCIGPASSKFFFLFSFYQFLQCLLGAILVMRFSIKHSLED
jgi:hypothetical protein